MSKEIHREKKRIDLDLTSQRIRVRDCEVDSGWQAWLQEQKLRACNFNHKHKTERENQDKEFFLPKPVTEDQNYKSMREQGTFIIHTTTGIFDKNCLDIHTSGPGIKSKYHIGIPKVAEGWRGLLELFVPAPTVATNKSLFLLLFTINGVFSWPIQDK